jgi:hypothetical protein
MKMTEQTDERATPAKIEEVRQTLKESNEDRKRDKLTRAATRAHEYRVQIWAQMELKIRGALAELEVLGGEAPQFMEADFTDEANLHHYASMSLTK